VTADAPLGSTLLRTAWTALTGESEPEPVPVTGTTGLGGPLPVPELAVGAVAAQLIAARRLAADDGEPVAPAPIDAAHVGFAFRSERNVWLEDRPVGPTFAPFSRFWRTADGWIRLHANYDHHRAAVVAVLGEDVGDAALRWKAEDLETAIVEAGGAAGAVRTDQEWAGAPQGRAVAELPLLSLTRTTDGPVRRAPLRGLRVLDLTRVIAGPVATRTLASHGADVLRLDSPGLAEHPGRLLDTGAGKRHALLDLATPGDRRQVEDLLVDADVVVQGYRPGALAAFGMDPDALADRHPHLVVVSLSAWGVAGPWWDRRGFDSLVQAATGISLRCGSPEAPGVLPAQALDHGTGHLAAATVLAALCRQRSEGGGWHGRLSLAQTAQWLLDAERRPDAEEATEPGDPGPYLLSLPSSQGRATMVAPPGSPPWSSAAAFVDTATPQWRERV
jgi:crotonobetainyl-CoA:carnitine CoA-transferase CaiB-like acyl-CoA transferase